MVWPDYIGLDLEPARSLARTASGWSGSVDAALRGIQAAETLTGEPVGVSLALDDVGNTSRLMSTAIDRAVDTVESYRVPDVGTYWQNQPPRGSVDQAYQRGRPEPSLLEVSAVPVTSARADWNQLDTSTSEMPGHDVSAPTGRLHPQWQAAAQDGLIPGGPTARIDPPALDMGEANEAIARLAAEVERLNGGLEAGVETNRRAEAFAELHALGRIVTVDEADDLGVSAGSWVHRDVATTALEWDVDYDEATLLHQREQVLAQEPSFDGHSELLAIASALAALHDDAADDAPVEADSGAASSRLSPGIFDGLVADRPESLDDPASLSDEALVLTIDNWDPSLGIDPGALAALVAERDARAGVTDTSTSEQRVIRAAAFTREVLAQVPQLGGDDVVGSRIVEYLVDLGYSDYYASRLAAVVQARLPGHEIAAHLGINAALGADAEMLGTGLNQLPSAADFEAFALETGHQEVVDLQLPYLDAVLSAYDTYLAVAGEHPSAELLVTLADYAIANGVTFSMVTRDYLGLRPSDPPVGRTATELTEPEVVELRAIIEHEEAVHEALLGHRSPDELLDGATWLFQRYQPDGYSGVDPFTAASSGELEGLFAERAAIEDFIAGSLGATPTPAQIDAQSGFIDYLDGLQLAVSLAGAEHFDPLTTHQVHVLDTLHAHGQELMQLLLPTPLPFDGTGRWATPTLSSNGLLDGTPFRPVDDLWQGPIPLFEINRLLAANVRSDPPLLSPGLAQALTDLIEDPDLVTALAPHRRDLHDPAHDVGTIDFDRVEQAAFEDVLANLTAPWADEVDGFGDDGHLDATRLQADWQQWTAHAETDPTIPRLIVDASEEVVAHGLHDASTVDGVHAALAVIAVSRIPGLSQLASLVDAGLYFFVDKDTMSGVLALAGAALSQASTAVREVDDAADFAGGLAQLGELHHVSPSIQVAEVAVGALGGGLTLHSAASSPEADEGATNWSTVGRTGPDR